MNNQSLNRNDAEYLYPHSRDVIERETSDNGFSKGWGMHFLPTAEYWFDVHTHVYEKKENIREAIDEHLTRVKDRKVQRLSVIPIASAAKDGKSIDTDMFSCYMNKKDLSCYLEEILGIKCASAILYLHYTNPDIELIETAADMGISGIKLHNAWMIMDGADRQIWLSDEWDKAFQLMGRLKLPVLWHVTQRLTDSPYTEGGRNSYWKEGWEKGVRYTNEDLLQIYLKVVGKYPDVNFISAHQLHIGWERLTELFDQYPNLYTDTTVGCFVRKDDEMYDIDRNYLRDVFIRYSDRILFGTDTFTKRQNEVKYLEDSYDGHIRFIKQLNLPGEALQKISHENAERLYPRKGC